VEKVNKIFELDEIMGSYALFTCAFILYITPSGIFIINDNTLKPEEFSLELRRFSFLKC